MYLSSSAIGRWIPARFDRLQTRLFLAIAGFNVLLLLLAWLIISRSFDRGLLDYLNRADEARLQPVLVLLADEHQTNGSWQPLLAQPGRWSRLLREAAPELAGLGGHPHGPALPGADLPHAHPMPGHALRLFLFDRDGKLLAGRPRLAVHARRLPVYSKGQIVGWLGYLPRLRAARSLEYSFAAEQNRRFALIVGGSVLAGLLVSAWLAHWLSRRIRVLAQGTSALIEGDFSRRLPVSGADELSQLAADFNRLAHTLQAAREARQQWIADIAHELRTPLTVLQGELEALQDGVRPLEPAALASLLQEVAQLAALVNDLHLLSMSDQGALGYRQDTVDMAALVRDVVEGQAAQLQSAGIRVDLHVQDPARVRGDAARLAQVLHNLLQNTVRYTDAPGTLSVELFNHGDSLELVWQDSSPGVAAADLPRLTERLFRVDAARSRASGGSGLGLAIVKAIIDGHGGQMRASSSALGGLRWSILLPVKGAGERHD